MDGRAVRALSLLLPLTVLAGCRAEVAPAPAVDASAAHGGDVFALGDRIALPDLRHAPAFPGIDPREADRFWDRWRLVTVRYRKDNGEQRFIYANELAWQALREQRAAYPDGSMFGKVAVQTREDPLFPNSAVPSFSSRIQLMKKDARAFAASDGWGYALYTAAAPESQEPVEQVVAACHACHRVAQARDFVFAVPFHFERVAPEEPGFAARFVATEASTLRGVAAEAHREAGAPARVRVLAMPLFAGSLSESVAPVAAAAQQTGEAHLLVDERAGYFLSATPGSAPCEARLVMRTKRQGAPALRRGELCGGVARWEEPAAAPARPPSDAP